MPSRRTSAANESALYWVFWGFQAAFSPYCESGPVQQALSSKGPLSRGTQQKRPLGFSPWVTGALFIGALFIGALFIGALFTGAQVTGA